jgi:hypothetical protein
MYNVNVNMLKIRVADLARFAGILVGIWDILGSSIGIDQKKKRRDVPASLQRKVLQLDCLLECSDGSLIDLFDSG